MNKSRRNQAWFEQYRQVTRPRYLLDLARDQGRLKRSDDEIHGIDLRHKLLSLHPHELPLCEAALVATNCEGQRPGMQIHHKRGRGRYLNDTSTFIATCQHCHTHIEDNPAWAKRHGYSHSKIQERPHDR